MILNILEGAFSRIHKILPSYISERNPKYLEINNSFLSCLIIVDYSPKQFDLIYKKLIDSDIDIQISFHLIKKDKYEAIKELTFYITNSGASIKDFSENREDMEIVAFAYKGAKYIRRELQVNNEELYNLHTYICVRSDNKDSLENDIRKVEALCSFSGLVSRRANFRQLEAFQAVLPLHKNPSIVSSISKRNVLTSSIISTFPFILSTLNDNSGIIMGKSVHNNSLIILDRFNRTKYKNSNMCVFGTSGSGKSYYIKLCILREFLNNVEQYIVDPEREYISLCEFLGGTLVKIGATSTQYINIFDIREKDCTQNFLTYKLNKLKSFFYLIYPEITEIEYSLLEELIIKTYESKGITFDDSSLYEENTPSLLLISKKFKSTDKMPLLSDLYNLILKKYNYEKEKNSDIQKTYLSFLHRLKTFTSGSLSFFNQKTNVNLESSLILGDIHDLGEENFKYGIFLFTELFWNKIKEDPQKKKIIYIDEIWRVIGSASNKETATFIYKIFKTIRKHNGGAVAITQDISDMFSLENGNYGKSIINNSSIKCIFKLEEENIIRLSENISITEHEKIEIKNLSKGEMLLIAEDNRLISKVVPTSKEHEIIENIKKEEKNGHTYSYE